MSAQVESLSLFESSNHVLDPADLVDLVSGATLRNSPPSRMVTSSPILSTSSNQCLTRPSSPNLDSTFSILGDQDHVVSQITLINGEKIWVREDKGPSWNNSIHGSSGSSTCGSGSSSTDDCNSSTDSINICVPLFVSTSNQVSELDLSSEMLDLTQLLSSATPSTMSQLSTSVTNCDTIQVLPSKPPQATLVRDRNSPDLPKPGNSLLRSALTGKTSYLMTKSKPSLPTFKPGSESSQIGEQKVEEILLLAKKRSLENPGLSMTPVQTVPTSVASAVFTNAGDKLVINNLLNTAASQLNLAPPNLSSLVPVRTGDTNNNIKSIQAPQSVISLVVDVGNNNNNNNNNTVTLPNSLTPTPTYDEDSVGGKKRMLKRQKSNSSSSSNSIPTFLQTNSAGEISPNSAGGNLGSSANSGVTEPRKEARLLHYCPICNKGFKDRYSVNVHVRTHTGEKPFSCALCGKCFRQKAHLAKHHQTHAAKQTGLLPTHSAKTETTTVSAPKTMQANTIVAQQPQTISTQPPITTATTHSAAETMAQTVSVSAGNSNLDKIVFPLSPVNVEIMEHT